MSAAWPQSQSQSQSQSPPVPEDTVSWTYPEGSEEEFPVVIVHPPASVKTLGDKTFRPEGSLWTPVLSSPDDDSAPVFYMQIGASFPSRAAESGAYSLPLVLGQVLGIARQGYQLDSEGCWFCLASGPLQSDLVPLKTAAWGSLFQTIIDWEARGDKTPLSLNVAPFDAPFEIIPPERRPVFQIDSDNTLQVKRPVPPPVAAVAAVAPRQPRISRELEQIMGDKLLERWGRPNGPRRCKH